MGNCRRELTYGEKLEFWSEMQRRAGDFQRKDGAAQQLYMGVAIASFLGGLLGMVILSRLDPTPEQATAVLTVVHILFLLGACLVTVLAVDRFISAVRLQALLPLYDCDRDRIRRLHDFAEASVIPRMRVAATCSIPLLAVVAISIAEQPVAFALPAVFLGASLPVLGTLAYNIVVFVKEQYFPIVPCSVRVTDLRRFVLRGRFGAMFPLPTCLMGVVLGWAFCCQRLPHVLPAMGIAKVLLLMYFAAVGVYSVLAAATAYLYPARTRNEEWLLIALVPTAVLVLFVPVPAEHRIAAVYVVLTVIKLLTVRSIGGVGRRTNIVVGCGLAILGAAAVVSGAVVTNVPSVLLGLLLLAAGDFTVELVASHPPRTG